MWTYVKSSDDEPMRLPKPMIGFNLSIGLRSVNNILLSGPAIGPPYFWLLAHHTSRICRLKVQYFIPSLLSKSGGPHEIQDSNSTAFRLVWLVLERIRLALNPPPVRVQKYVLSTVLVFAWTMTNPHHQDLNQARGKERFIGSKKQNKKLTTTYRGGRGGEPPYKWCF